jgi:hypothetical protein
MFVFSPLNPRVGVDLAQFGGRDRWLLLGRFCHGGLLVDLLRVLNSGRVIWRLGELCPEVDSDESELRTLFQTRKNGFGVDW